MHPLNLFTFNLRILSMWMDTQTVMTLRLMGLSGAIPARRGETRRMVAEKGPAMGRAYAAGVQATMAGKRPDEIVDATLAPLGRRVRANRKRLLK